VIGDILRWLTLEAPVVLHYLKAPADLTAVCFIAF
jgi:hypothetical protein